MINSLNTKDKELIEEICMWRSQLANAMYSIFHNDPVDVAHYEEELLTYKYFDV